MSRTILVLNAGSSSVKFQLFGAEEDLPLLAKGRVTAIGAQPLFQARGEGQKETPAKSLPHGSTHEDAIKTILDWVEKHENEWTIIAAGHRVVHGGRDFSSPAVIDDAVMASLRALSPLAPLHQPHNLAAIDILAALKPALEQIACFDTAFHSGHGRLFTTYALPHAFEQQGVRRYGFHGLSYEWIARVLMRDHPEIAGGRVIAAHLGNGASLCALRNGKSIDTTMGMTALEGLPMGTRSGSIDPGALIYMIRDMGMTADEAEHILYNESGLLGLSGISNDVEILLASPDPRARFALDYFALRTARSMAAMAVSMGGVDTIVFTGGIGENAAPVRDAILNGLSCLAAPAALVIPANEERMIALHVLGLI